MNQPKGIFKNSMFPPYRHPFSSQGPQPSTAPARIASTDHPQVHVVVPSHKTNYILKVVQNGDYSKYNITMTNQLNCLVGFSMVVNISASASCGYTSATGNKSATATTMYPRHGRRWVWFPCDFDARLKALLQWNYFCVGWPVSEYFEHTSLHIIRSVFSRTFKWLLGPGLSKQQHHRDHLDFNIQATTGVFSKATCCGQSAFLQSWPWRCFAQSGHSLVSWILQRSTDFGHSL